MTQFKSTEPETPDLESSTEDYARRFEGDVGQFFLDVQEQAVMSQLPPPGECRILDVGGGHGQLVGPLVRAGYKVSVFASDHTCRDRLNRIVGEGNYELLTGNLLDLPCETNQYEAVLAFRLLPHLNDWQRFIGELCRVANTQVTLDYPDIRSINILSSSTFALKRKIEKNTRTYQCFRRSQILSELNRHGFRKRSIQGQFVFPMALHRYAKSVHLSRLTEKLAALSGLTYLFGSPVVLTATSITNPS